MKTLQNQTAVITGGATGIGLATARRLARDGANIALWDIDEAKAQAAAGDIADAITVQCNIADEPSVAAACEATLNHFGQIDILVNSAGITGGIASVEDMDPATWRQVLEVNLTGTFLVNKAVLPAITAASSTSPRSPARKATQMPRTTPPPRRASSALPRRSPRKSPPRTSPSTASRPPPPIPRSSSR